jgi:hypothetical protein
MTAAGVTRTEDFTIKRTAIATVTDADLQEQFKLPRRQRQGDRGERSCPAHPPPQDAIGERSARARTWR